MIVLKDINVIKLVKLTLPLKYYKKKFKILFFQIEMEVTIVGLNYHEKANGRKVDI